MYVTAEEIAVMIEERRDMTHEEIAVEIGLSVSTVSQALAKPSSRRLATLARIAEVHGIAVETGTPLYEANVKKDDD